MQNNLLRSSSEEYARGYQAKKRNTVFKQALGKTVHFYSLFNKIQPNYFLGSLVAIWPLILMYLLISRSTENFKKERYIMVESKRHVDTKGVIVTGSCETLFCVINLGMTFSDECRVSQKAYTCVRQQGFCGVPSQEAPSIGNWCLCEREYVSTKLKSRSRKIKMQKEQKRLAFPSHRFYSTFQSITFLWLHHCSPALI